MIQSVGKGRKVGGGVKSKGRRREALRRLVLGDDEERLREEGTMLTGEEEREVEMIEELFLGEVERVEATVPAQVTPAAERGEQKTNERRPTQAAPCPLPPASPPATETDFNQSLILEGGVLLASLHSELDSVEEMESKMTSITELLSSFSALVEEQSEQIAGIEEAADLAKEEVEKGGDELVVAKKRMEAGGYWLPAFNVLMGVLLLFLHYINY